MVLFVVGEPGVGKTTLVRRLLEPDSYLVQRPKWTVGATVCAAGHYTGDKFDGADTVPYNGVLEALTFWSAELKDKRLTIFDGDRFSNASAVSALRSASPGLDARCVLIAADPDVVAARRVARGSNQNAAWVKGRRTKSLRFAHTFEKRLILDATKLVDDLETELRGFLS
jgi:hypothetical protein